MDDDELQRIADALENSNDDEPQSRLILRELPGIGIALNRAGCMALAAKLLRLAAEPPSDDGQEPTQSLAGIQQIRDPAPTPEIAQLRRTQTVHVEPPKDSKDSRANRDRLALLGCAVAATLFGMIVFGGIIFWVDLFSAGD